MTLAQLVYRIASDPTFAAQFAKEPQATLTISGLTLDDRSTSAILSLLGDHAKTQARCTLGDVRYYEAGTVRSLKRSHRLTWSFML